MTTALAPAPRAAPMPRSRGSRLHHLVRFAERLRAEPEVVRRQIRDILASSTRTTAVAARSYWHVNGFAKIRIVENRNVSARLHVWPEGPDRLGDVDPHSHRWQFASWVAFGSGIVEKYFVEHEDGLPHHRFEYGRRDTGVGYLRRPVTVGLREVLQIDRGPGEVYRCPLDIVHTVAPRGSDLMATVLLQGPVRGRCASVYRLPGAPAHRTLERALRVHEVTDLFEQIVHRLPKGR